MKNTHINHKQYKYFSRFLAFENNKH